MHALVDKLRKTVLWEQPSPDPSGGPWAEWLASGRAVWVEMPAGAERDELVISDDGSVTVDAAKQADRIAKADAKAARRATIKGSGSANSVAALRAVVRAMAEELGFEVDA